jgi:hypothetical protein
MASFHTAASGRRRKPKNSFGKEEEKGPEGEGSRGRRA